MSIAKKIRLAIALATAVMLAGCSGADESASSPNTPSSPQQGGGSGGGSTPAQITITVAGDEHVTLKAEKNIYGGQGKNLASIEGRSGR